MMQAVILRQLGNPEVLRLEAVPDPRAGPDEVIVRLRAAALNHRDLWIRAGKYAGIRLPIILGSDGAGEVSAVGEGVDRSLLGTRVVINPSLAWGSNPHVQGKQFKILGLPDDGTYAQFVRIPAINVHPMPERWSFEEAAALPLGGLTAYRAVVTRGLVQKGETVFVTGIGGGVATLAFQIARSIGARVVVSSASDAKIAKAVEMGAAGGVNYRDKEWIRQAVKLCGGEGPDVAIDGTGGETFAGLLEAVKPGGRIVSYGATTGPAEHIEVRRIFWKQLSIAGSTMGTPEEFAQMLEHCVRCAVKPVVDRTYELAHAANAHARMENKEQFGKIVLTID